MSSTSLETSTRRNAMRAGAAALTVLACLAAIACDRTAADGADSLAAAPATSAASDTPAAALNDAQIAHVAVTANAIDSAAGELAKQRAESPAVRAFAETMITDHSGVNEQAVALATRLQVTPEDNAVSRQLTAGADSATTALRGATGSAFDQAYMEREVAYHQAVLDALDQTLIPGAQNTELAQLLQNVRPAIAAHLERARSLRDSLAGGR